MSAFLDHASTTTLRDCARSALINALETLGNPSSVHSAGQRARAVLEDARDQIAKAANCNRSEVIFLSGGTEANNQAIKGLYWSENAKDSKKNIIIISPTEHHALIDPVLWLETNQGARVHYVKIAPNGTVDLDDLAQYVAENSDQIALISLMWVNNETGVITDIARVCEIASAHKIPVHSDAVAAFGHVPIDFAASGLAALSISGHKLGSPIGVGALIVSRSQKPVSLLHGGGQERGLRSGTMNHPLAAAFAAAAKEAVGDMQEREARLLVLRDYLEKSVLEIVPTAYVTASGADRVPHNAHFVFPGTQSDSLLFLLDQAGVNVSSGSACQAGVIGPSHVLIGMGKSEADAKACIRVTLGHSTQKEDVQAFIDAIGPAHSAALSVGVSG